MEPTPRPTTCAGGMSRSAACLGSGDDHGESPPLDQLELLFDHNNLQNTAMAIETRA
jgi:hypothetical protein